MVNFFFWMRYLSENFKFWPFKTKQPIGPFKDPPNEGYTKHLR